MSAFRRFVLVLLVLAPIAAIAPASPLGAQDAIEIDGTPDFRAPPFIGNGTYTDTLVAGEAVWYAILYTDDTEISVDVSLANVDLATNADLELTTSLISPTLGAALSGSDGFRGTAFLTGGGPETQSWFIEIALETTGRLGVQHEVTFTIDGVEDAAVESCLDNPSCTLDEDLATLDAELEEIQANIDGFEISDVDVDDEEAVQAEIERLEKALADSESEISAARERERAADADNDASLEEIALICAPEADCDTAPSPGGALGSIIALIVGALILVGGGLFFASRLRAR